MRILLTIVVPLAILTAAVAHADVPPAQPLPETITMDTALKVFRERGLDLLIADAQVASAEADVAASGAVPNPTWSVMPSYTFATPNNTSPWGVSVALGDGNALEDSLSGKRWLRLKVAKSALAAARMTRADAQRTLELQVKTLYIQAVFARDSLDFALLVQNSMTQVLQLNQTRYNAGAISEADLAKVETAKLEADQAVDAAVQGLRAAKVQLAFLLGARGRVPDFHVEQDLPKFVVPPQLASASVDSLLSEANSHRPDLKAAEHQRERASASLALAKRLRFPDLALGVTYTQQGPANDLAVQPPTIGFGLSGTLPIFYLQRGEIARAAADARVQDLSRAKVEAQLASDVEGAFNSFLSSRKLVERMESRLLDRSRRARDLVSLQYQKGAASLLEYLDAQRTYIANNLEYLQDLTNYWTAVFQLEAAVGMELR
jgi:cobalt-zinc-cadmium efflux system outer membrane protein